MAPVSPGKSLRIGAFQWPDTTTSHVAVRCPDWGEVAGKVATVAGGHKRQGPSCRRQTSSARLAPESATPVEEVDSVPDIQRRDLLGGLIHEYKTAA